MPIACVDIVLKTNDGKFLLVKRDNEPCKNELWLVGGRVQRDESLAETAKRKVKEEIGIEIHNPQKVAGGYETICSEDPFGHSRGTHTINTCYMAEISDEELNKVKLDQLHSGFE